MYWYIFVCFIIRKFVIFPDIFSQTCKLNPIKGYDSPFPQRHYIFFSIDPSTNRPIVLQFFYWGHLCLRWTLSFGERHDPKSVTWVWKIRPNLLAKEPISSPLQSEGFFFGWCFFFHGWGYLMMYVWIWYMLVSWRVSTKTIQNLETLLISHNSWCHCEPRPRIS